MLPKGTFKTKQNNKEQQQQKGYFRKKLHSIICQAVFLLWSTLPVGIRTPFFRRIPFYQLTEHFRNAEVWFGFACFFVLFFPTWDSFYTEHSFHAFKHFIGLDRALSVLYDLSCLPLRSCLRIPPSHLTELSNPYHYEGFFYPSFPTFNTVPHKHCPVPIFIRFVPGSWNCENHIEKTYCSCYKMLRNVGDEKRERL